jgi:uncharacterized protein
MKLALYLNEAQKEIAIVEKYLVLNMLKMALLCALLMSNIACLKSDPPKKEVVDSAATAGVSPDSVAQLKSSASQGDAESQYNQGVSYALGKGIPQDHAEAAKWYRKAADQGLAKAQDNLGCLYDNGQGVSQDYVEAAKWYRKAADQGSAAAQLHLGFLYMTGNGTPENSAEAARWYRKAADQGLAEAQWRLGLFYESGEGAPKDYVMAHMWYNLASAQGAGVARTLRDGLSYTGKMTAAQIIQAQALASKWKPTKTETDQEVVDSAATAGVRPDSVAHLKLRADQGIADAQYNLGVLYDNGQGVSQDYVEAAKWYRKAADQGDASAQFNLGALYTNGQGVPQDFVIAHTWLNLAAAQGHVKARTLRDGLENKMMTAEQIAQAQSLAVKWKPVKRPTD